MKFSSELTNILEAIPNTALLINHDGEIHFTNKAAEKIFGFPPTEIINKNISLLIPNSFSQKETPITRIDHDSEGKRKNGTTFPIRFSIGELKQENERFFIAIVFDITDIKENENRLLLSEERALLSQRFANIGYWDWSIASGDLFWSERIAPMFGYSVGTLETSYENFLNAIHPEDRERVTHAVNECVNNGAAYEIEHRVVWPDGTTRWLLERGDVIRDKSNHPTRMLGVVQDITSRKRLEEELLREKLRAEEGARVKSTFLANMSHEIRTPMNSILGFVELALDDESVSEDIRTHLKTAHRSARGLLGLINDILDVSKMEEGKVEIDESIIYLPRFLKEALQILHFKAEEKGLTLSLELDPKLYQCVISDQNRIRQVLINIIGNSIKFTKKGSITLSVIRAGDNYLLFEITDTGIGMTEAQVEKIFDPFTQADESTARLFGGTGLGTTISKQLVELMGGEIWVQSKLNEGTTFSFTIKYTTPQCAENCDLNCGKHADVGEAILPLLSRSFNILIADDIPENATLVAIRLKQQGSSVQIATNGKEAIELYKNGDFDLILMDVQMPVMDGLEATSTIRKLEEKTGKHIPIIALTASVMISEQKSCIESGMDDVVSKPIEFYELFHVIEKIVPKDRGKNQNRTSIELKTKPDFKWPDRMVGIDIKYGLRNWQNSELYARSLLDFSEKYKNTPEKLINLISSQNFSDAQQLSHALKGVAGNLAISDVAELAIQISNGIKQNDIEKVNSLIPTLKKTMGEAIASIATIKIPNHDESVITKDFNPELAAVLFKQLTKMFERGESNDNLLRELLDHFRGHVSSELLDLLYISADNFDFKTASQYLKKVGDLLNLTEPVHQDKNAHA